MSELLLIPAGVVVTLISSGLTYLALRRKSSGSISTSESKELWDAYNSHQERVNANLTRVTEEMEKLRALTVKLDAEVVVERRGRVDCEARITVLESRDSAAVIIETAKKEAATIRFDAAKAAKLLESTAKKAAAGLADEAATAKRAIDDAKGVG